MTACLAARPERVARHSAAPALHYQACPTSLSIRWKSFSVICYASAFKKNQWTKVAVTNVAHIESRFLVETCQSAIKVMSPVETEADLRQACDSTEELAKAANAACLKFPRPCSPWTNSNSLAASDKAVNYGRETQHPSSRSRQARSRQAG